MGSTDSGEVFDEGDSSEVRPALKPRASSAGADGDSEVELDMDDLDLVIPTSIPPPPLPAAITEFAKYEVLGLLATGGMAELYLAREASELSQRLTILKVLKQQLVDSQEFEQMFLREGRLAMQLLHPNICTTYEFGKWRGHFYIAMEYIDGVTLREVLQRLSKVGTRIPVPLALHIGARVAAALEHAHTARDGSRRRLGVVHRDVSPQNVMLRFDGVVKLLDFGVAKVQQGEEETRTDSIKGKFGYLAPEQAVAGIVDARTDVFALGIVLWELLCGKRLYKRESEYEAMKAIIEEEPPSIVDVLGEHAAEIDAILRKALSKRKEERFQSAGELQQALEEVLSRYDITGARHVAAFVRPHFPEKLSGGPKLSNDDTVIRRLRPSSDHPLITSIAPPRSPAPASKKTVYAVAIASTILLAGVLAAVVTSGDPEPPIVVDEPSETIETTATVEPTETETETIEASPMNQEIVAESMDSIEDGTDVSEDELRSTEDPTADQDEDVDEGTEERRRRRRERRRLRRNRPGFTADPGF